MILPQRRLTMSGIAPHFQKKNVRRTGGWDEPKADRGWLFAPGTEYGQNALGYYLDYGPDHYRTPHEYCGDYECTCSLAQPGHVLAVACHSTDHGPAYRYFESTEQAKRWIAESTGYTTVGDR